MNAWKVSAAVLVSLGASAMLHGSFAQQASEAELRTREAELRQGAADSEKARERAAVQAATARDALEKHQAALSNDAASEKVRDAAKATSNMVGETHDVDVVGAGELAKNTHDALKSLKDARDANEAYQNANLSEAENNTSANLAKEAADAKANERAYAQMRDAANAKANEAKAAADRAAAEKAAAAKASHDGHDGARGHDPAGRDHGGQIHDGPNGYNRGDHGLSTKDA